MYLPLIMTVLHLFFRITAPLICLAAFQSCVPQSGQHSEPPSSAPPAAVPAAAAAPAASQAPASMSPASFIPEPYVLLDSATGDLNLDAYPDQILVLRHLEEAELSLAADTPVLRPLLILLGQADGGYLLAARNDRYVYCAACGGAMGDPYAGITIKQGYFSAEHYGGSSWRWTRIITCKYAPADQAWYLHRDGRESFHSSDPETVEEDSRTTADFGKVRFEAFDVYAE